MKLPFPDQAVVEERKLTEYLLNPTHPQGRTKATLLAQFGFDRQRPDELRQALLQLARTADMQVLTSPYGTKFVGRGRLRTPSGRDVQVATVWILRDGLPPPILVTAYPA